MDILTHVMIGAAATSPFWATHPLESVMFTFGSVLPDIDALSRQFGKVAFLRFHQGWTHALPVIVTTAAVAALLTWWGGLGFLVPSIFACGLGAVVHVLTDFSNTFGVRLLAPFDRRRHCIESVFFIDLPLIVVTAGMLLVQIALHQQGGSSVALGIAWLVAFVAYFAGRIALRRSAGRRAPDAVSLIPSAFVPWRFDGLALSKHSAQTFRVDLLKTKRSDAASLDLPDVPHLAAVPEFAVMRELSPGFCAVRATEDEIECHDLRTRRTFGTNFGRLILRRDCGGLRVHRFDV